MNTLNTICKHFPNRIYAPKDQLDTEIIFFSEDINVYGLYLYLDEDLNYVKSYLAAFSQHLNGDKLEMYPSQKSYSHVLGGVSAHSRDMYVCSLFKGFIFLQ